MSNKKWEVKLPQKEIELTSFYWTMGALGIAIVIAAIYN
jgi:hypothetical protein